jgi:hypothetical protein
MMSVLRRGRRGKRKGEEFAGLGEEGGGVFTLSGGGRRSRDLSKGRKRELGKASVRDRGDGCKLGNELDGRKIGMHAVGARRRLGRRGEEGRFVRRVMNHGSSSKGSDGVV